MNNKYFKILIVVVLFMATALLFLEDASAQCPMCRIAAESNLKNGGTAGKGLNAGILFLLSTPYVLIGTIGFIWYRNRKSKSGEQE